jgi:hypothetical protein
MSENHHLKVSLCASFIVEPIQDYLIYWSKEFKMNISYDIAPYNFVFQQLLDTHSLFNQNGGINILLIRIEDWLRDKKDSSPSEQIHFLNETYQTFIDAITHSRKIAICICLIVFNPLRTK